MNTQTSEALEIVPLPTLLGSESRDMQKNLTCAAFQISSDLADHTIDEWSRLLELSLPRELGDMAGNAAVRMVYQGHWFGKGGCIHV